MNTEFNKIKENNELLNKELLEVQRQQNLLELNILLGSMKISDIDGERFKQFIKEKIDC
jgi:hypothetical protein